MHRNKQLRKLSHSARSFKRAVSASCAADEPIIACSSKMRRHTAGGGKVKSHHRLEPTRRHRSRKRMTCAQCQATGGSRLPRNSSLTRTLILSALRELFAICAASSHCPSRQHPPRTETFRRQRFWLSRRHSEGQRGQGSSLQGSGGYERYRNIVYVRFVRRQRCWSLADPPAAAVFRVEIFGDAAFR